MTEVWITEATCTVRKKGHQQAAIKTRDALRIKYPDQAPEFESYPWYVDPEGEFGGDELLEFNWSWRTGNGQEMCKYSFLHRQHLPNLEHFVLLTIFKRVGKLERICFVKASYALQVLQSLGSIPIPATLMNEDERPEEWDESDNRNLLPDWAKSLPPLTKPKKAKKVRSIPEPLPSPESDLAAWQHKYASKPRPKPIDPIKE